MTREEIVNSMSLQDAIQVFKDTNTYGTMDIAKSVILKALEQEPCDYYDADNKTCRRSEVPQESKTDTWSIKEVADTLAKHGLIVEQETYEDAISRQAVITLLDELARRISDERCFTFRGRSPEAIMMDILSLPSVTPQKKIGHWEGFTHSAYHGTDEYGEPIWREVTIYHCSQCNRRTVIKEKFCPNCGTKMESEDK